MRYTAPALREAGLNGVKWTRTSNGAPILSALGNDGRRYVIDAEMWAEAKRVGIKEAFENFTALGRFFSIRA